MNHLYAAPLCIVLGVALAGCGATTHPNSPDVAYSSDSLEVRALQVPPDLTDISDGEQFILPGSKPGPVSRNTLLPVFDTVRFQRDGASSWLDIEAAPEELWPRLLAFARQQNYAIDRTEPTAGMIATQWRAGSAENGVLKNLIGGADAYSRVVFRLERTPAGVSRLFARVQPGDEDAAADSTPNWPAASHDPERTNLLLTRLLVFFGVEEQRARGILDEAQARNVLDDAVLQTTGGGSQLVVHRGFVPSFDAIALAAENLDLRIRERDRVIGRLLVAPADAPDDDAGMLITVSPVHVSAVRVAVTGADGQRLEATAEQTLLQALRDRLMAG